MTKKQRTFRNIIMIVMIVALAAGTFITVNAAKDSVSGGFGMHMQGEAPDMNNKEFKADSSSSGNSDSE